MRLVFVQWLATVAASCCYLAGAVPLLPYFEAKQYNYTLHLNLDDDTQTSFTGEAILKLKTTDSVVQDEKDFVISAVDIDPQKVYITYPSQRLIEVPPTSIKKYKDQTIGIPGREFFLNNSDYEIRMIYSAKYGDDTGIVRTKDGDKNFITSRLYPTFGKKIFPSIDNPGNVIPISLNITVISKGTPLIVSGLKQINEPKDSGDGSMYQYFQSQISIPTWGIFFTIGDYEKYDKHDDLFVVKGGKFPETVINSIDVVKKLEWKEIVEPPPVFVIVPNLPAHESGLGITAFSSSVGNAHTGNSGRRKQVVEILTAIIKSHYGSVVSPRNWEDLWISESVSLYMAESLLSEMPGWEKFKTFSPNFLNTALDGTWSDDSSSVMPNITDDSDILKYLKDPAIAKGAAILGMVESLVAEANRLTAFKNYLSERKGSSVTTDDFLNTYSEFHKLNTTADFPEGKTLLELIKPWLEQTGYPAIFLDRQGSDIFAVEHRYSSEGSKLEDNSWMIPIKYAVVSNTSAPNSEDKPVWYVPNNNAPLKLETAVDDSAVVILNSGRPAGLYRTLYDDADISVLKNILMEDMGNIPASSRAKIISDSFAFAESGQLKYSSLLDMLRYLKQETELEPWEAALKGFRFLWEYMYFLDTEDMKMEFENYVGELIRPSYLRLGLGLDLTDEAEGMLRSRLVASHCDYDDLTCEQDTYAAYVEYIVNNKQIAAADMYPVIFCNGIKNLTDAKKLTEYLEDLYKDPPTEDQKRDGFYYLSCLAENKSISILLSDLLIKNMTQPISGNDTVLGFQQIASRPEHLDLLFAFFTGRQYKMLNPKLTTYHKAKMIDILGQKGSTDAHIGFLKKFVFGNDSVIQEAVTAALSNLEKRQKFITDNYYEIQLGLFGHLVNPTSTTPTPGPPTPPNPTPTSTTPSPKPSGASTSVAASFATLLLVGSALAFR